MNHLIYAYYRKQYCLSKTFQRRRSFNHLKKDFENDLKEKRTQTYEMITAIQY